VFGIDMSVIKAVLEDTGKPAVISPTWFVSTPVINTAREVTNKHWAGTHPDGNKGKIITEGNTAAARRYLRRRQYLLVSDHAFEFIGESMSIITAAGKQIDGKGPTPSSKLKTRSHPPA
jgi:hypothetical protein